MVSWNAVGTAIGEFLKDYFPLLLLAGMVAIYILVRKIIKTSKAKKEKAKQDNQELELKAEKDVEEAKAEPYDGDEHEDLLKQEESKEDFNFFMAEKEEDKVREDVIKVKDIGEEIKQLSESILDDSNEMDTNMSAEFQKLKQQLKEINSKKQQVRKYGEGLVALYKKYDQREKHITAMMMGLERLTKK
tara:strand:+ start:1130 stop:1696 length:567 start_codon:yes stop_codon:yes gene_type:complete